MISKSFYVAANLT